MLGVEHSFDIHQKTLEGVKKTSLLQFFRYFEHGMTTTISKNMPSPSCHTKKTALHETATEDHRIFLNFLFIAKVIIV